MWARHTVVRRRKIAEHLTGKHNQQAHGRGGTRATDFKAYQRTEREKMDAKMRDMGFDPSADRDRSWSELKDTFPLLQASQLDKMDPAYRQEAIDTLNELGRMYPEAARQLRSITVKRAPGGVGDSTLAATNGISEMRFVDATFGPGGDFASHQRMAEYLPDMYAGPLTVRYVAAHEFGHVMAFQAAQRGTNSRDWGVIADVVPRSSSYGRESGDENLAELFAAFHTGGNLTGEQRGFVEAFIKDVEGPKAEAERDDHQAPDLRSVPTLGSLHGWGLAQVALHGVSRRHPAGHRAVEGGAPGAVPRRQRDQVRAGGRPPVALVEHLQGQHSQTLHGRRGSINAGSAAALKAKYGSAKAPDGWLERRQAANDRYHEAVQKNVREGGEAARYNSSPEKDAALAELRAIDNEVFGKPDKGPLADAELTDGDLHRIANDGDLTRAVMAERYGVAYAEFGTSWHREGDPVNGREVFSLNDPDITPAQRLAMLRGMEAMRARAPGSTDGVKSVRWSDPPSKDALGQYLLGDVYLKPTLKGRGTGEKDTMSVVVHEFGHGTNIHQSHRAQTYYDLIPDRPGGVAGSWRTAARRDEAQIRSVRAKEAAGRANESVLRLLDARIMGAHAISTAREVKLSNYAGKSVDEFTSEAYRMFVLQPKRMKKYYPSAYGLIAEAVSAGVGTRR